MTELIVKVLNQEPAGKVDASEKNLIESTVKHLITSSKRLEGIALCGTLPPGLTGSTYSLIAQMKPHKCFVLLDAYQNIECLNTGKINILKINSEESRKLLGVHEDVDVITVAKQILSIYKLQMLAITDGPGT